MPVFQGGPGCRSPGWKAISKRRSGSTMRRRATPNGWPLRKRTFSIWSTGRCGWTAAGVSLRFAPSCRATTPNRCGCVGLPTGAVIFRGWAAMLSNAPFCATTSTTPRSPLLVPCAGLSSWLLCWKNSTVPTTSGPMRFSSDCPASMHLWHHGSTRRSVWLRRGRASWNCSTTWPTCSTSFWSPTASFVPTRPSPNTLPLATDCWSMPTLRFCTSCRKRCGG